MALRTHYLKNKKVLVTGASGFIGSHCIIDLIDHGYQVVGTIRDMTRESGLRKIFSKLKIDNHRAVSYTHLTLPTKRIE